ncbi:MAG TPA: RidA family protein [Longimicrobiales bacterium]|nr:RidA family protein [Longimicrobiales bacterium]
MERIKVKTAAPWAATVGYSRAVRVGNHVYVAGTAPVADDGSVFAPGNPYLQAQRCLEIIVKALAEVGARPDDVVRTRMFVKSPEMWTEVGRAHGEIFANVQPATTMVFVDFIEAEMLVEIEADAVIAG